MERERFLYKEGRKKLQMSIRKGSFLSKSANNPFIVHKLTWDS
jgi:hypothetical protein